MTPMPRVIRDTSCPCQRCFPYSCGMPRNLFIDDPFPSSPEEHCNGILGDVWGFTLEEGVGGCVRSETTGKLTSVLYRGGPATHCADDPDAEFLLSIFQEGDCQYRVALQGIHNPNSSQQPLYNQVITLDPDSSLCSLFPLDMGDDSILEVSPDETTHFYEASYRCSPLTSVCKPEDCLQVRHSRPMYVEYSGLVNGCCKTCEDMNGVRYEVGKDHPFDPVCLQMFQRDPLFRESSVSLGAFFAPIVLPLDCSAPLVLQPDESRFDTSDTAACDLSNAVATITFAPPERSRNYGCPCDRMKLSGTIEASTVGSPGSTQTYTIPANHNFCVPESVPVSIGSVDALLTGDSLRFGFVPASGDPGDNIVVSFCEGPDGDCCNGTFSGTRVLSGAQFVYNITKTCDTRCGCCSRLSGGQTILDSNRSPVDCVNIGGTFDDTVVACFFTCEDGDVCFQRLDRFPGTDCGSLTAGPVGSLCPVPCRKADGTVVLVPAADCDGTFLDSGVNFPCLQPDGTCFEATAFTCLGLGYTIIDTDLSSCPVNCLKPDGTCVVTTLEECTAIEGVYSPYGEGCVGACLYADGRCYESTEADCNARPEAVWQGEGVPCAGACELPNGECVTARDPTFCTNCGGTWQGFGAACPGEVAPSASGIVDDPAPLEDALGLCQLPDGTSAVLLASECSDYGGTFLGTGE